MLYACNKIKNKYVFLADYNLLTNDSGDIVDLDVISSDLPDGQCAFFESIAEYVEHGSFICLRL